MNCCRVQFYAALTATCLIAQLTIADQLPTYDTFDADAHTARRLRAEPLIMSKYPATFSVALSANGKQMRTVDVAGRVSQWSLSQTKGPALVAETESEPACAVLSHDTSLLAFADPDGGVAVMQLETKEIKFRDSSSSDRTVTLSFSSNSGLLAGVTEAGNVRVWKVGSGKLIREIGTASGSIQTVAFSPDGRQLAIASYSHDVLLHRINIGDGSRDAPKPHAISIGDSRITALAYMPDGQQLVIAAADGTTQVHDLAADRPPIALATHPFATWAIAFEPGGQRMATGSWDGTIKLWDTKSWQELQSLKSHEESVSALVFAEQGLISTGLDGRLLGWSFDIASIGPAAMIAGRTDPVWVSVYSADGKRLFVGGNNRRFELWDIETRVLLSSREGHPTTRCAAFSPDGKMFATGGDDGQIWLVDPATGETRQTLMRHPGSVSAVVFADDGRTVISGCDRGVVKVWDVATGHEKATWREHKQQIYCVNISPDGKWLITGGGNWTTGDPGELIVWDLKTGRVRANVTGHRLAVWTVVFTPGGEQFASSDSSGAVKIWDIETCEELRTLQHTMWVRPLAMSPDGSTLAVGRGDGSVRLWDTATWTERASCDGHDDFTFSLQYAPGGETLVTGGNDGTVRFWRMEN